MPRFLYWTDLHQEHGSFVMPAEEDLPAPIDGVLLGGDIDRGLKSLEFAEAAHRRYNCPVVLVNGNHEFYNHNITKLRGEQDRRVARLQARGLDIHLLDGSSVEIAGARIVGATLWTDFELDPLHASRARLLAGRSMNDYSRIRTGRGFGRHLTPEDTLSLHQQDKEALLSMLSSPASGPTVVLTHHMPIRECLGAFQDHPLNASFTSDLLGEIRRLHFDVWAFGHSHFGQPLEIESETGPKRVFTNPRGMPSEQDRTGFDPLIQIEL